MIELKHALSSFSFIFEVDKPKVYLEHGER